MEAEDVKLTSADGLVAEMDVVEMDGEMRLVVVDGKTNEVEAISVETIVDAVSRKEVELLRADAAASVFLDPMGSSQMEETLSSVGCGAGKAVVGDGSGCCRSLNTAGGVFGNSTLVCADLGAKIKAVAVRGDGKIAAAYGSSIAIAKLDSRESRTVKSRNPNADVECCRWDPSNGSRLAFLDSDGRLMLWSIDEGDDEDLAEDEELASISLYFVGDEKQATRDGRNRAWFFDWKRQHMAVPGRPHLVLMPPVSTRTSEWGSRAKDFFFGGDDQNNSPIVGCAFNGDKADKIATVAGDGAVVVWIANALMTECQPAALYRPDDVPNRVIFVNQYLCVNAAGRLGAVSTQGLSLKKRKKKVTFTSAPVTMIEHEAEEDEDLPTTQQDEDDDDEDEDDIQPRPVSNRVATPGPREKSRDSEISSRDDDDDDGLVSDDHPFFSEESPPQDDDDLIDEAPLDLPTTFNAVQIEPQPPFQPGSTHRDPDARFLHWSGRGVVVSRRVAETERIDDDDSIDDNGAEFVYVVEVEHFSERESERSRSLRFTSRADHACATLGDAGAAFATTHADGDDTRETCRIEFKAVGAWHNHEWTATLPAGEQIVALAAGDDWVAACSDRRWCRMYTNGGLLDATFGLPGHCISAAAKKRFLALAYHAAPPEASKIRGRSQDIAVALYDVRTRKRLDVFNSARLPLRSGVELRWLGFADDDGCLIAMDSDCVFYALLEDFGWTWTPVLDAKRRWREARKERRDAVVGEATEIGLDLTSALDAEDDVVQWPVYVRAGQAFCVTLKHGVLEPKPTPRPILTPVAFETPVVSAAYDVDAKDAERSLAAPTALARHRVSISRRLETLDYFPESGGVGGVAPMARLPASADELDADKHWAGLLETAATDAITARDKALLRQMVAAVKHDRLQFALDVAQRLSLPDSLDVALRVADASGLDALAHRVEALVNARDLLPRRRPDQAYFPAPVDAPRLAVRAPVAVPDRPEDDDGPSPPRAVSSSHDSPLAVDDDDDEHLLPAQPGGSERDVVASPRLPARKVPSIFARASNKDNVPNPNTPKAPTARPDGATGPVKNPFAIADNDRPSSGKKKPDDALDGLAVLAFSPRDADKLKKKRSATLATNPVNKLRKYR